MGIPPVIPTSGAGGGDVSALVALAIGVAVAAAGWLAARRVGAQERPIRTRPKAA